MQGNTNTTEMTVPMYPSTQYCQEGRMLVSIKHLNHSLSLKLSARCLEPPNNIPLAKYIFLAVVTSRTLSNIAVYMVQSP